ncbi:aromatase/cyclase [Actinosynnema sp. NPDC023658]|uniref:aromatase/cyclase n=1 Tax=Actinosynnema sp. NPDC023658 TaxID=3155465 RepID=UPI0033D499F8
MATTRHARHEIAVSAPADDVYVLIAAVEAWPRVFPPTVHVEVLERDGDAERLRFWATANGEVKTWTSRRELDPAHRRVSFRQEVSQHPVASMGGRWQVEEVGGGKSLVVLDHHYAAVDDAPDGVDWIERALDRNSHAELAALRAAAERGSGVDELLFSFEDSVQVAGAPDDVYAFVRDAGRWSERLPHVARVVLTEDVPDLQTLEMDTRTKDGQVHTTRSVRVCFPSRRIVYKQLVLPALLAVHNGEWTFTPNSAGVLATSRHTVVLDPAAIPEVLGEGATAAQARDFVRGALSANSTATLELAKAFAEAGG